MFNRLDLTDNTSSSNDFALRTDKVVNNMNASYLLGDSWDVGFQGGSYSSANSRVADYSYGLSFGYTVTRNV